MINALVLYILFLSICLLSYRFKIKQELLFALTELIHRSTCSTFVFCVSLIICLGYSKNQRVHSSIVIFTLLDGLSQVTATRCHKSPLLPLPFVMYVTLYTYRKVLWPRWLLQGNDKVTVDLVQATVAVCVSCKCQLMSSPASTEQLICIKLVE